MQAAHLAVSQQQIEVCSAGFWCLMLLLGVKVVHCVGFKSGLLRLALLRAPGRVTARLARVSSCCVSECGVLNAGDVLVPDTAYVVCESLFGELQWCQLL